MSTVQSLRPGVLLTGVILLTLGVHAVAQTETREAALPNFHMVNANLYRGAQPKTGGLKRLREIGVRTIVNLRGGDDHTREEEQEAGTLGLRYYNVALPEFSKPKSQDVQRALDVINAPENQPVFVHCRRGADRTGTIVAAYRITHDGWTAVEAKKEAEKYGMSWTQRGMKHYIDEFYQQTQQRRGNEK